jgi:acyl carrier protein
MTDGQIMETLTRIFEEEFEIDPELVTPDANLYQELDLDSLDSVDLIVALENDFDFKIDRVKDEQVLKSMRTVADIMEYIKTKETEQSA